VCLRVARITFQSCFPPLPASGGGMDLLEFLFRRSWWTAARIRTAPSSNNLALSSSRLVASLCTLHPLLPFGRHGDGRKEVLDGCHGGAPPRSAAASSLCSLSSAPHRPSAVMPSTFLAEGRPIGASSTPAESRRQFFSNLPAGEPKGRPHSPASTASFGILVPKWSCPRRPCCLP